VRNDHGKDYDQEYNVVTLELKLCKSVTDNTADQGLNNSGRTGKQESVKERLNVIQLKEDCLIGIQSKSGRNKTNGYVNEVFLRHERTCDLSEEGEKNDVSDTDKKNKAEDVPNGISKEAHREEFRFQSVRQRRSLKINLDLVLGFLHNLRAFNIL